MNLLLLEKSDFVSDYRVHLTGRRCDHLLNVLRVKVGETVKAGVLTGQLGKATVWRIDNQQIELQVELDTAPPTPLPLTLILALPRPKMLKRILQGATSMGVKKIYLINSYRVEKSYWQTPLLSPESIREQLLLGLEQGVDTLLPEVHLRTRFKPFAEDELATISNGTLALVAHPIAAATCPEGLNQPSTLAVGPEGGFIDYEIKKLKENGFLAVSLGNRILRVETAIPFLVGRLFHVT